MSFENIKLKWIPSLRHYCPSAVIILCGTKVDLRKDETTINNLKEKGLEMISFNQGVELAKEIKAASYVECSSREGKVKHVFDEAINAVLCDTRSQEANKCIIQ